MARPEPSPIRFHEDVALFREAVAYTAAETAFAARLIEKDYFCTVLLHHLSMAEPALVFKGGTCLAKVHSGFYRLSEDLDFVIPVPEDSGRAERSRLVAPLRSAIARLERDLSVCRVVASLKGANNSTQYMAIIGYSSLAMHQQDTIKIEIALREPLLTPGIDGDAQTLLRNPISGHPLVPAVRLLCISRIEAMAEKLRAALSRREVAIRDFYDVDYAVRQMGLQLEEPRLIELIKKKLAITGNDPMDVSTARMAALQPQLAAQLKPVLRSRDFADFDLGRAIAAVTAVAALLEPS